MLISIRQKQPFSQCQPSKKWSASAPQIVHRTSSSSSSFSVIAPQISHQRRLFQSEHPEGLEPTTFGYPQAGPTLYQLSYGCKWRRRDSNRATPETTSKRFRRSSRRSSNEPSRSSPFPLSGVSRYSTHHRSGHDPHCSGTPTELRLLDRQPGNRTPSPLCVYFAPGMRRPLPGGYLFPSARDRTPDTDSQKAKRPWAGVTYHLRPKTVFFIELQSLGRPGKTRTSMPLAYMASAPTTLI